MIEDKISEYQIYTFEECLSIAEETKLPRHILLGNGFSIAYNSHYKYPSICNSFNNPYRSIANKNDNNVEHAMGVIKKTPHFLNNIIIPEYRLEPYQYKYIFIDYMLKYHFNSFNDIPSEYILTCYKKFIKHFDLIFTTNYDLYLSTLIYHPKLKGKLSDGFYNQRDSDDIVKLIHRGISKKSSSASVLYLHGAIHFFTDKYRDIYYPLYPKQTFTREDRNTIVKESSKTNERTLTRINKRIDNKELPLIVLEDSQLEKTGQIQIHDYLSRAFQKLQGYYIRNKNKRLYDPKRVLFIFGQSLEQKTDGHIIDAINHSVNTPIICYGIYLKDKTKEKKDEELTRITNLIKCETNQKDYFRDLYFFDTSEMDIWGKEKMNTQFQHLKL